MNPTIKTDIDLLTKPQLKRVSEFNLDDCPRLAFTRLLLEVVENGLGQSVRVPVLVARGKADGPVFGITAALHGNELNGIPVIHQLLQKLDLKRLKGTIVAVVVANVPGFLRQEREFTDGVDLNHVMPGKVDGNQSQVYAYNFVNRIACQFDYLVDLHTASFGRVNSLYVRADMSNETTAKMALLQRPQIILHDPPSDYTLRGALADRSVPAITLEICDPQLFQPKSIRRSIAGIRRILSLVKMIAAQKEIEVPPPVICKRSFWMYTDRGGLLSVLPQVAEVIAKGDTIARQTNAFGDVVREYEAPHDGIIIGKSVNPVSQSGSRIVHFGILDSQQPADDMNADLSHPSD